MPDRDQGLQNIYECVVCHALSPKYTESRELDTGDQIAFHECLWEKTDKKIIQKELDEIGTVVEQLRPFIGRSVRGSPILDVGAGRGTLLKALRDHGYNAYGIEPAAALVAMAREYHDLDSNILRNIDINEFLLHNDSGLKYSTIILWHVLEHLDCPIAVLKHLSQLLESEGCIVIQLPLLNSTYIFPEHYYFPSHDSLRYIADTVGFSLQNVFYDEENMYVTAVFANSFEKSNISFLNYNVTPDPFSQLIILSELSRNAYKEFSREHVRSSQDIIESYKMVVDERDNTISVLEQLARDRADAMRRMDVIIKEAHEAAKVQASMIDQRDETVLALERLCQDRFDAAQVMNGMMEEAHKANETQAAMIDQRDETISALERLSQDRFEAIHVMNGMIEEAHKANETQARMIDQRDETISALQRLSGSLRCN
jgi:SAM-dependent methyltransferase